MRFCTDLSVVVWLTCFVQGGLFQSIYVDNFNPVARSYLVFYDAAERSTLLSNIDQLNSSVLAIQNNLNRMTSSAKIEDLIETREFSVRFVRYVIDFGYQLTSGLTNLATDRNIPTEDLFEQFELTFRTLVKTSQNDFAKYQTEIMERMGCPIADTIEEQFNDITHQLSIIVDSAQRIKQSFLEAKVRYFVRQFGTSGAIIYQVDAISSSVMKTSIALNKFATTVSDIVRGLETANAFMAQILTVEKNSDSSLKASRADVGSVIDIAESKALDVYYSVHQQIKADLNNIFRKLNIFTSSKTLSDIPRKYSVSYFRLFQFLSNHNSTDVAKISNAYNRLAENTDGIICQASDVLFGAMKRTINKLVSIVLERGPQADTCFTTYSAIMSTPYTAFSNLVQGCISSEAPRWSSINNMVDSLISLMHANTADLLSNTAKCPTFADFLSSESDHTRGVSCLKTNLNDLDQLTAILDPQLQLVLNLVQTDVKASKYRLESCLLSQLHQMTAGLRTVRARMDDCAGPVPSGCSRKSFEHDGGDWYERWEVCEDGNAVVGPSSGRCSYRRCQKEIQGDVQQSHGLVPDDDRQSDEASDQSESVSTVEQTPAENDSESALKVDAESEEEINETAEVNVELDSSKTDEIAVEEPISEPISDVLNGNDENAHNDIESVVPVINIDLDSDKVESSEDSSNYKCGINE